MSEQRKYELVPYRIAFDGVGEIEIAADGRIRVRAQRGMLTTQSPDGGSQTTTSTSFVELSSSLSLAIREIEQSSLPTAQKTSFIERLRAIETVLRLITQGRDLVRDVDWDRILESLRGLR